MISEVILNDPSLSPLRKKIFPNTCLFNQGDLGRTMFVIIEGMVSISRTQNGVVFLVGIPGPGEIIGERALLDTRSYKRNFTARAKTDCTVLEISADSMKIIQEKSPSFHLEVLRLVISRLDKANHLTRILQETNLVQRFIEYVLYFDQYHTRKLNSGTRVGMTVPEIHQATVLNKELIKTCVEHCLKQAILIEQPYGYVLQNPDKLKAQFDELTKLCAC